MSAFCNAPSCERCWIDRNSIYDDDGRLDSIRQPVRLLEVTIEQCAWCGDPTIFGAYVRTKRVDVHYPPPPSDNTA